MDEGSHAPATSRNVGEFWYMDWTRKFDESPSKNKCGLVFVGSKTWLLRTRFFQEKSAERLTEGTGWLRNYVRRTSRSDLLEVHGDSDTSWAETGRGRDFNSAVVDEYVNSVEPPTTGVRCKPGTQSLDLAERDQKEPLVLCNFSLHYGRLSLKGWEEMLFAAEGQLDHHPMPQPRVPTQRAVSHIGAYSGHRPGPPPGSRALARARISRYPAA